MVKKKIKAQYTQYSIVHPTYTAINNKEAKSTVELVDFAYNFISSLYQGFTLLL